MISLLSSHNKEVLGKIASHRLLALDVMRGFTIMAMILVNNPGSWSHMYAPLKHAEWHGWTPTDLIFPFFIFIVGVSISFSINIMKSKGMTNSQILTSATTRTVKLILLGWFLALFYYNFVSSQFSWLDDRLLSMRIMGVLQRIGIVYLICTCLFLYFKQRGLLVWGAAFLIGYTLVMLFVPYADDNGTTYQGLWENGNNFAAWLDHTVLTATHVYAQTAPFTSDPEGIFSTIPALTTCISGILVGSYIHQARKSLAMSHLAKMTLIGIVLVIAGYALNGITPINKALWTPSYVLLSSGLAMITLNICLYLIDIKHYKQWTTPFIVFGVNSIAFFMFAGVLARILIMVPVADSHLKYWITSTLFTPYFSPMNASLMFSLGFLLVSYAAMFYMYKKNIFWKV